MVSCLSPNGSTTYSGSNLPDRLVVATLEGVVTAERAERGFRVIERSLPELHISSLCFEPTRQAIFAASYAGTIHVSHDGGESWQLVDTSFREQNVYTIASRTTREGVVTLYVGTEPVALYSSADYGQSWTELPAIREMPNREKWTFPGPPHEAHLKNMVFDDADAGVIYASIEQGGLFKTTDGALSWSELEGIEQADDDWYRDVHRILVHPGDPRTMFITGGDGVSRSDDAGATWKRVLSTTYAIGYPDGLVVNPLDPNLMFVSGAKHQPGTWRDSHSADAHIARSTDGGASWSIVSTGLPDPLRGNIEALSLSVSPAGSELFAGTTDGDVYASTNNGDAFTLLLEGLGPISKGGHYRALTTR